MRRKYMLCNKHKEALHQYGIHDTLAAANERLINIHSLDCGNYAVGIIEVVVEESAKEQALESDGMLLDVMQRHMNRYYQDDDVALIDDLHCYLGNEFESERDEKKKRIDRMLAGYHDKRYGAKHEIEVRTMKCLGEAIRNMLNDIYPN